MDRAKPYHRNQQINATPIICVKYYVMRELSDKYTDEKNIKF